MNIYDKDTKSEDKPPSHNIINSGEMKIGSEINTEEREQQQTQPQGGADDDS